LFLNIYRNWTGKSPQIIVQVAKLITGLRRQLGQSLKLIITITIMDLQGARSSEERKAP
jgi:hypothetical protein